MDVNIKKELSESIIEVFDEITNSIIFVFLCGAGINQRNSIRKVVREYLDEYRSQKIFCVLPEEIHGLSFMNIHKYYKSNNLFPEINLENNLVDNENLYTLLANVTVVVSESPSSYAESGAFINLLGGIKKISNLIFMYDKRWFLHKNGNKKVTFLTGEGIEKKNDQYRGESIYYNCFDFNDEKNAN